MTTDMTTLAELTGHKLQPHQQAIIDFVQQNEDRVIPFLMHQMGRVNRSFGKLGVRASTAAEAARNLNAALLFQGIIMHEFDKKAARIERAAIHSRRVRQTYRKTTRAERRTEQAIRISMKRERREGAPVGFSPVGNDEISRAYTAARAAVHAANPMATPMQSHNEALRVVRGQLPPRRRDYFELGPDRSKQATVPGYVKPNIRPKSARPAPVAEMAEAA